MTPRREARIDLVGTCLGGILVLVLIVIRLAT